MNAKSPFQEPRLTHARQRVEAALEDTLAGLTGVPERLAEAMSYSLLAGGKRLRPVLSLLSAEAVGGDAECALEVAVAMECIHTYSLVHDDLPAMDDDDLRRGRPTSHKVFGEDIAILAGDALLTLAFEVLTDSRFVARVGPAAALAATRVIGRAAGSAGMVGGQVIDVGSAAGLDLDTLKRLHRLKTGALLRASAVAGGIAGGADDAQLAALAAYGDAVGLAFQVVDDVLDVVATTETLGKPAGSDARHGKTTFVTHLGLDGSRREAAALVARACDALAPLGAPAEPLRQIAEFVGARHQ